MNNELSAVNLSSEFEFDIYVMMNVGYSIIQSGSIEYVIHT